MDQNPVIRFIRNYRHGISNTYQNASYSIRIKSTSLFYSILSLSVILPLLLLGNILENANSPNLLILFIAIGIGLLCFAMVSLQKGHYHPAVALTLLSMVCSLIGYIILDDIIHQKIDFVHTLYLSFPIIFFQALFGSSKRFFILPLVFIAFAAASYQLIRDYLSPQFQKVMQGFQTDYFFAMSGACVIGYLSIKINRTIIRKLEERNEIIRAEMTERKLLEREMVQANENIRRKIGHELHDDLGQILIGIDMRNKVLEDNLNKESGENYELARKNSQLIETMISKMRKLSKGMGLLDLNRETFYSALHNLVSFTEETFNVDCKLDFGEETAVAVEDDLTAIQLYHIAQEAINNAIRHGKAKKITVSLATINDRMKISIRDDGVSFDSRSLQTIGSGLKIMAHRANLINGCFSIERGESGGTVVSCAIPTHAAN